MTRPLPDQPTLDYARPSGPSRPAPHQMPFIIAAGVGIAALFVPAFQNESIWTTMVTRFGGAYNPIDTLLSLLYLECFFMAVPLLLMKIRLRNPRPWSPGALACMWLAAVVASLHAFPLLLTLAMLGSGLSLEVWLHRLCYLPSTLALIGGVVLAFKIGRIFGPGPGLHFWVLACYTSAALATSLPFIPLAIQYPGFILRLANFGIFLYGILALVCALELTLWTRTIFHRSPALHP